MSGEEHILAENAEVNMLREVARGFFLREWPADKAVPASQDPAALQRIWQLMGQQGWLDMGAGSESGGLRFAIVLMEELGRAACPAPFLDAFLANTLLNAAADLPGEVNKTWVAARTGASCISTVLGAWDGDPNAGGLQAQYAGEDAKLSGRASFVEGASLATHYLAMYATNEVAIFDAAAAGLRVLPTPGFVEPALADVEAKSVPACRMAIQWANPSDLARIARLCLTARSLGAADRGFELIVDYAKMRVQFGKKIGQFQAIQHKLANVLIDLETSRLALVRAAAAHERGGKDWRYSADAAVSLASPALRRVCLETHHAFGGVSFWHEHEMPRHFRRIHADLTRCGGVHAAREAMAESLLNPAQGVARLPDLDMGAAANAFREELRVWLADTWDGKFSEADMKRHLNERLANQDFSRKLAAKNWLGLSWPKKSGGQERSVFEHLVFEEEMSYAEAPIGWHLASVNMLGPTLMIHGSPEQKATLLPAILRGDICFCLGYSEPENGSDLAGLKTRAVKEGDSWVIRGQKLYTSTASYANYCWLAARTDPDAVPNHAGISVFLVPMHTPGITLQPLIGLNEHRSNVVFWDDVRVPASAVVGEVNGGWKVITAALAFERIALAAVAARGRGYFDRLLEYVRHAKRNGKSMSEDSLIRHRLATLAGEIEAARLLSAETARIADKGGVPVHHAAMSKVYSGELMERMGEAALEILGSGAALRAGSPSSLIDGNFEFCIRDSLMYVIGGGTNEIQRNIIALRGLGLPR